MASLSCLFLAGCVDLFALAIMHIVSTAYIPQMPPEPEEPPSRDFLLPIMAFDYGWYLTVSVCALKSVYRSVDPFSGKLETDT